MGTRYEEDVIAWSLEQAALLRAGKLSVIDVQHIAEEIEDVGKSEQRELSNRMAVLLCHLLKWKYQPERRGASGETTIHTQRNSIARRIRKTPSLKASLADPDWWADAWDDAIEAASKETGLSYTTFPDVCPWTTDEVLDHAYFPAIEQESMPRQK
ncbi:DUF29 domain-containing protein [Mycetohabitans sp. B46]|uniref:DUF29 domain-containing protein n=1 Tax=Mycetohabitans sp. B46 TaxID=2772536 RepID=UPI00307CE5AC